MRSLLPMRTAFRPSTTSITCACAPSGMVALVSSRTFSSRDCWTAGAPAGAAGANRSNAALSRISCSRSNTFVTRLAGSVKLSCRPMCSRSNLFLNCRTLRRAGPASSSSYCGSSAKYIAIYGSTPEALRRCIARSNSSANPESASPVGDPHLRLRIPTKMSHSSTKGLICPCGRPNPDGSSSHPVTRTRTPADLNRVFTRCSRSRRAARSVTRSPGEAMKTSSSLTLGMRHRRRFLHDGLSRRSPLRGFWHDATLAPWRHLCTTQPTWSGSGVLRPHTRPPQEVHGSGFPAELLPRRC